MYSRNSPQLQCSQLREYCEERPRCLWESRAFLPNTRLTVLRLEPKLAQQSGRHATARSIYVYIAVAPLLGTHYLSHKSELRFLPNTPAAGHARAYVSNHTARRHFRVIGVGLDPPGPPCAKAPRAALDPRVQRTTGGPRSRPVLALLPGFPAGRRLRVLRKRVLERHAPPDEAPEDASHHLDVSLAHRDQRAELGVGPGCRRPVR